MNTPEFTRQIAEVQQKLGYDKKIIEDVLRFHLTELGKEIAEVRPWKKRMMIHSWGYVETFPLCYNPFSIYFNEKEKEKAERKYKKELENINSKI